MHIVTICRYFLIVFLVDPAQPIRNEMLPCLLGVLEVSGCACLRLCLPVMSERTITLVIESARGRDARFTCIVPGSADHPPVTQKGGIPAKGHTRSTISVLCVGDQEYFLQN